LIDAGIGLYLGADSTQYVWFIFNVDDQNALGNDVRIEAPIYNWVLNSGIVWSVPTFMHVGGTLKVQFYINNNDPAQQQFIVSAYTEYVSGI